MPSNTLLETSNYTCDLHFIPTGEHGSRIAKKLSLDSIPTSLFPF